MGPIPDMTGSQLLPELVGRDVAKELTFSGRVVSGEDAVALGLATRTDPDPRRAALELARGIAARSPHAIRAAKRLLDLAGRVDLAAGFAAEQGDRRAHRQPEPGGGGRRRVRQAAARASPTGLTVRNVIFDQTSWHPAPAELTPALP